MEFSSTKNKLLFQEAKEIDVKFIAIAEQLADSFTKPLPNLRFSHLRGAIGIVSVSEI
jgi:hypothetical protein